MYVILNKNQELILYFLIHFTLMFHFNTPWKRQKTRKKNSLSEKTP